MSGRVKLRAILERIDRLSFRERIFLLVAMLTILVLPWDSYLMEPIRRQQQENRRHLDEIRVRLVALEAESAQVLARHQVDPDAENRRRLAQLQEAVAGLDEKLRLATVDLIAPREMARVLEEILDREPGLRLVRLENLPAIPLVIPPDDSAPGSGGSMPNLYRHPLRLEFEGTYLDALRFLTRLERLPRQFFWEDLQIRVVHHPLSRIVVTVHTLSLKESWIGV